MFKVPWDNSYTKCLEGIGWRLRRQRSPGGRRCNSCVILSLLPSPQLSRSNSGVVLPPMEWLLCATTWDQAQWKKSNKP